MGGRPEGGADRCGDMGYATTNGIELRIFCPAVKDMWVARRKIIDCSSKPFSTDLGSAVPGVIYPNALATGKRSINVSVDGQRAEFSSVFSSCWPAITTTNMMIDATIVRAHQHSAGARKKTARKPSANRAED